MSYSLSKEIEQGFRPSPTGKQIGRSFSSDISISKMDMNFSQIRLFIFLGYGSPSSYGSYKFECWSTLSVLSRFLVFPAHQLCVAAVHPSVDHEAGCRPAVTKNTLIHQKDFIKKSGVMEIRLELLFWKPLWLLLKPLVIYGNFGLNWRFFLQKSPYKCSYMSHQISSSHKYFTLFSRIVKSQLYTKLLPQRLDQ